jgi:hypothetical protein
MMKPCFHVKKQATHPVGTKIYLVRSQATDESYPFNGCGFWNFIRFQQTIHDQVDLEISHLVTPPADTAPHSALLIAYANQTLAEKRVIWQRMAWDNFVPDLEDGFSLTVFLAELREIISPLHLGRDMIMSIFKSKADIFKHVGNKTFKDLKSSKGWSSAWLQANFALLPFLRDIATIMTRLSTLREDLDRFLDGAGVYRTLYFQHGVNPDTFSTEIEALTQGIELRLEANGGGLIQCANEVFDRIHLNLELRPKPSNMSYHATMKFKYDIPALDAYRSSIYAAMDRFGLNSILSDAWQLIPFSFVLDWFLSVGDWLERFDHVNLPVQVTVRDFCDSFSYDLQLDAAPTGVSLVEFKDSLLNDPEHPWAISPYSLGSCYRESIYYRWKCFPQIDEDKYPNLRLPSGMAVANAIALVDQLRH